MARGSRQKSRLLPAVDAVMSEKSASATFSNVPGRRQGMSIRDWPSTERPREKLLDSGPQGLSEAELLAILIQTGTRGQSALDIARTLLAEFGTLRGLLTADRERVC